MACPRTFFDMNDAYVRISEIVSIERPQKNLIIKLRTGAVLFHQDYNGSAAAMQRRLLDAIAAVEG